MTVQKSFYCYVIASYIFTMSLLTHVGKWKRNVQPGFCLLLSVIELLKEIYLLLIGRFTVNRKTFLDFTTVPCKAQCELGRSIVAAKPGKERSLSHPQTVTAQVPNIYHSSVNTTCMLHLLSALHPEFPSLIPRSLKES